MSKWEEYDEDSIDLDPFFAPFRGYSEEELKEIKERDEEMEKYKTSPDLMQSLIKKLSDIPLNKRYEQIIDVDDDLYFIMEDNELAKLFSKVGYIKHKEANRKGHPSMKDLITYYDDWSHLNDRYPQLKEYHDLRNKYIEEIMTFVSSMKSHLVIKRGEIFIPILEGNVHTIYGSNLVWKNIYFGIQSRIKITNVNVHQFIAGDELIIFFEVNDMFIQGRKVGEIIQIPKTLSVLPKGGHLYVDVPHLEFKLPE